MTNEAKVDIVEDEDKNKIATVGIKVNVTELAKEVYQNLPEYAAYSFRCDGFDYDNMVFKMFDKEEDVAYVLDLPQIEEGMALFFHKCAEGKLQYNVVDLLDPGYWDIDVLDCAIQCALLKDVIYG